MSLDEMNAQAAANPYEDFQPPSDWDHQKDSDTLILMLPGFRKDQLKVQVSSHRVLRLSGERKITDNKWRRFRMEVPLPDSLETSGISAKFEAGMLYVKLPKVKPPPPPPPPLPPTKEPSKPHQPTSTKTDHHKPDASQQHVDEKEPKEQNKTEESKTEEQPPPSPEEPKEDHEGSQEMPQKEMRKAETEDKNRTSEAQKMRDTTQTTFKEQKNEDSEKKVAQSKAKTDEKEMGEDIASKVRGIGPEWLSKSSMMYKSLDMISDMVLEIKKQKKMGNLVVLVLLVLLIGLYIKSVVKSSFAGPRNQEL